MKFTKMHGCGNDYVYVSLFSEKVENPSEVALAVSDRHTGIGADGLILIAPSDSADFRMIMFNADGSEGEMCGNGIRCIGKYVYDHGLTKETEVTVETLGGTVSLSLRVRDGKVDQVTVDMGVPRPVPDTFHVRAKGDSDLLSEKIEGFDCSVISMGNPHCVIPVEEDPYGSFPFEEVGPKIESHTDFPSRTNVEFVRVLGENHLEQRTWERGSGETFACGSGACAVGLAYIRKGICSSPVRVDLRGGSLSIGLTDDGRVMMTGPAAEVFSGEWPTIPGSGR
ncbi:MAG: diaminopimelate epimerase [Planctomycetota bacterium]|jgi:diaminopimelate epimerase|nr:diaminopimelate epimerase [Planctomycetota bacterium]